ncbi:MerR family transcriptional regulator [Streptomyces sp. NPDC088341]|uniref:DNA polymerase III subunit beta family protein n=1 Tax=Streptomyces sp. NPDC088341 TaxID=3154870 RepID=UPI00341F7C10
MDKTTDRTPEFPGSPALPDSPAPAELLSISAFARRVGLAPSALRFYDDCRVLRPTRVDGATGYRYYSTDQEARARLLRSLRMAGLPLADVGVVLDGAADEARTVLERHRETVRDRTRTADATIAEILRSLSFGGSTASTASAGAMGSSGPVESTVSAESADTVDSVGDRSRVTEVRLDGAELASAVRQVVPAVGRDGEHPVLGCVLMEIESAEVRLVATDRYRLSLRVLGPTAMAGPSRRLLVEAAELIAVGAWASRHPEVTVEAGPFGARVHGTDGSANGYGARPEAGPGSWAGSASGAGSGAGSGARSRELALFDGRFPAYREMLSELPPARHRVIVDRSALLAALHGFEDAPGVALRLGGRDEAAISLPDGSRTTVLQATVLGTVPLRIGFDPAVLAPALEAGVGPDVLLEISSAIRPVLVRSADQGSFTTLVMPIALTGNG